MGEHTATPWRNQCFQVYGADNSKIAHTGMGQLPPYRSTESEANAAFIVTACNSYTDLVKALEKIEKWCGEFPETGRFWDKEKTEPMSYAAAFGSNGERDFMRAIARSAIAPLIARKMKL